jgi:FAD:protein FMN transferase
MKPVYQISFRAMGCAVQIQLETEADGQAILQAVPAQVEAIEARLSRFRPLSELSVFNRNAGQWTVVSETLFDNLCAAKHGALITDGLYNPLILPALLAVGYDQSFEQVGTPLSYMAQPVSDWRAISIRQQSREVCIPPGNAVDLGGVAKGWTAEKLAHELAAYGACMVNIGGDIAARGRPGNGNGWQIKVAEPGQEQALQEVMLWNMSIVTSGLDYRHWHTRDGTPRHHIIDPRTGECAQTDVRSVTVIHPHAPTAEVYAKAVLLLGSRAGLDWLSRKWDAAGLVARQDGAVLCTDRWLNLTYEREFYETFDDRSLRIDASGGVPAGHGAN